ncbi:MAG TPA: hypothetical protein VF157_07510, partial [Chloroflexota bacterium]
FDLPLPAGTPAGVYQLELQLRTPDGAVVGPDSSPLTYDTPRVGPVQLGPLTIADPVPGTTAGQPPAGGDFGPLRLVAWQPPVDAEQGQFVPMNLWWQASAVPGGDWDVSLHVVDASGQTWAGHDDQPRMAYNPTSLWAAGQLERDVQMLLLPAGMPPGSYTVLAGWYDASSHAPIGSQNVPLGQIAVKPSSRPDPSSLDIPHALRQEFAQGLTLLGYELPNPRVIAGQPVPLRLFWQTARQPAGDLGLTVHFDGRGATLPLPATSQWQPGQLMETRLSLPTAPDWAGSGRLGLSLDGGPPQIELPQSITVEAPNRLTSLPSGPSKASPATLAGAVALAGYREDAGGGELRLTLYWQPLMPLPADLHVFTHLLDGQSHVVSQHDGVPASGQRPTSTWTAGEYVEDVHELTLPSTGGPFQIEVGLYDPATGRRLGDRLLLGPPP